MNWLVYEIFMGRTWGCLHQVLGPPPTEIRHDYEAADERSEEGTCKNHYTEQADCYSTRSIGEHVGKHCCNNLHTRQYLSFQTTKKPAWVIVLTVIGQAPKKPAKNLQIKIVCRSFAVAHAMLKTEKPNDATTSGSLLPLSSENGAHRTGPVAKPRIYNDVPNVATT
jgi:hypothetical protein